MAVVSVLLGALVSLGVLVLLAAGAANASPDQVAELARMGWTVGAALAVGLVGGVGGGLAGRWSLAACLGAVPTVVGGAVMVVWWYRG